MTIFAPLNIDINMPKNKKILFHTLGCKLNFSESSTLAREFENNGFERVNSIKDDADIHIINSCSVTDNADKKCRYLIRKIHHQNPNAIIAVTGCYAQLKSQEISKIEGVSIVVGNNEKSSLVKYVKEFATNTEQSIYSCQSTEITSFFSSFSMGDRTRAFLKVQDGCSYHCSYCTIPLARGESRNISISEIVSQAEQIAKNGVKEIVLTGVNIGDFGRSTNEKFIDLLKNLDCVNGIERYRISSIEPNLLTNEILEFTMSSNKFQPHFHIPLQAGSDKILKGMRRRYTVEQFSQKINLIRSFDKNIFIGIDVIVGFPGESQQEFDETFNLLSNLRPSYLHIFPYSERDNTDAVKLEGKVSTNQKNNRVEKLTTLSKELHIEFCERFVEKEVEVLIEGFSKGGVMFGYTPNYVRVELPYKRELINTITKAKIVSIDISKEIAIGEIL